MITVDLQRRVPGRGAYLHPRVSCMDHAERRHAVGRALRVSGVVDLARVREYVEQIELGTATASNEAVHEHQIVNSEEG